MFVVFLGAPGVGKGTQAALVSSQLGLEKISVGDMLRHEIINKTEIGLEIEPLINEGKLIPDEVVTDLVIKKVKVPNTHGYLIDGFPRNIVQADSLKHEYIIVNYVVQISMPDTVIIERLSGRMVHLPSGRTYHKIYNPPLHDGVDDITGESLVCRHDDEEEVVHNRLVVYHEQTTPLIDYYSDSSNAEHYIMVDGNNSIEQVTKDIIGNINNTMI